MRWWRVGDGHKVSKVGDTQVGLCMNYSYSGSAGKGNCEKDQVQEEESLETVTNSREYTSSRVRAPKSIETTTVHAITGY